MSILLKLNKYLFQNGQGVVHFERFRINTSAKYAIQYNLLKTKTF